MLIPNLIKKFYHIKFIIHLTEVHPIKYKVQISTNIIGAVVIAKDVTVDVIVLNEKFLLLLYALP